MIGSLFSCLMNGEQSIMLLVAGLDNQILQAFSHNMQNNKL